MRASNTHPLSRPAHPHAQTPEQPHPTQAPGRSPRSPHPPAHPARHPSPARPAARPDRRTAVPPCLHPRPGRSPRPRPAHLPPSHRPPVVRPAPPGPPGLDPLHQRRRPPHRPRDPLEGLPRHRDPRRAQCQSRIGRIDGQPGHLRLRQRLHPVQPHRQPGRQQGHDPPLDLSRLSRNPCDPHPQPDQLRQRILQRRTGRRQGASGIRGIHSYTKAHLLASSQAPCGRGRLDRVPVRAEALNNRCHGRQCFRRRTSLVPSSSTAMEIRNMPAKTAKKARSETVFGIPSRLATSARLRLTCYEIFRI